MPARSRHNYLRPSRSSRVNTNTDVARSTNQLPFAQTLFGFIGGVERQQAVRVPEQNEEEDEGDEHDDRSEHLHAEQKPQTIRHSGARSKQTLK